MRLLARRRRETQVQQAANWQRRGPWTIIEPQKSPQSASRTTARAWQRIFHNSYWS